MLWVGKPLARATEPQPERPASTQVAAMRALVELLETAGEHLKRPAVIVRARDAFGYDRDIRLNIAGQSAKVPGSINVCSAGGVYDERVWYGRVTRNGWFWRNLKVERLTLTAVAQALTAMASDPAKAAEAYGHLTGLCCFCTTALRDPHSKQVGYDPVCATHFGLPWPPGLK